MGREGRDGLCTLLVAVPRAMLVVSVFSRAAYSREYRGAGVCRFPSGPPPSTSAPQPTPMKMFLDKIQVEFLLCRVTAENTLLGRGAAQDTLACRERAKIEIIPLYGLAQGALREQTSAVALLEELYAAWLKVMDGIAPAATETLSVYIARLNALQRLLTEMRQRLEIAVP